VAFEQFTEGGRDVVRAAEHEARTLRHTRIGTEHLLLGVLSRPDGPGARALAALGVTLGQARAQVMRIVGLPETPSPPELGLTPPARDALAGALREAIELGETEVGAEHVLLALLRERDSVAVRVLRGSPPAPAPRDVLGAYALLGVLAAGGSAAELLRARGVDEDAVRTLLGAPA
jgi:ATP-dependent Clp protease ATP-binding subunit ClpA